MLSATSVSGAFFLAAFVLKFRAEYWRIEMSFKNEFSKLKLISREQ